MGHISDVFFFRRSIDHRAARNAGRRIFGAFRRFPLGFGFAMSTSWFGNTSQNVTRALTCPVRGPTSLVSEPKMGELIDKVGLL